MNTKLIALVLCVSLWSLSMHVNAGETSPESLVTAYFDAFKSGDMSVIANHMHRDELVKFKDMMFPVVESALTSMTPEDEAADIQAMRLFAGDDSIETIKMESSALFFARFMNWILVINPEMKQSMSNVKIQTIGFVPEEDMAHVVYRIHVNVHGSVMTQTSVITMRKQKDQWKLMLTGEIQGMAEMLQSNLEPLR